MTAKTGITLTVDGTDVPIRSLRLDRGLAYPVGRAQIVLPAGVAPPAVDALAFLTAQTGGSTYRLMTGSLQQVADKAAGAHLTLLEPLAALNVTQADTAYSATTAGQIITDLCAAASVPVGTILPGLTIPHMVLGSGMTLLRHCLRLAQLSGLALTSDANGLVSTAALAVPVPTGSFDTQRAAQELADVSFPDNNAKARVTGAGAFGASGPGMTTLPMADPASIQSGPSDAAIQTRAAALRILSDTLVLQTATDQRSAALSAGVKLHTPLPVAASPGDVVTIPDANGLPLRLTRIESLSVTLSATAGLSAQYAFSDVKGM